MLLVIIIIIIKHYVRRVSHHLLPTCSMSLPNPCPTPGVSTSNVQLPGCPRIVTRAEWGARPPTHTIGNMPATPIYVFIHHGTGGECFDKASCIAKVRAYQNYHIDGHGNELKQLVRCRFFVDL